MKRKNVKDVSESESESDGNTSDEELQEAFSKGILKPGLNTVTVNQTRVYKNSVTLMKQKLDEIKLKLPWIERLDMINAPAPMAPELALQMQDQEVRRAKELKGNKKLQQFDPTEDPVLNDFRRETMFHRQAQGAVMDGIIRLKKLGIPTTRPDDYFAQMAKTDEHMHKVRQNLQKKQAIAQRSDKMRQLRQQRKVGKQMQIEATLKKHADKKKMLDEVKKYRKGARQDLDFLDDKKGKNNGSGRKPDPRALAKRKMKDAKFGFGGKKKGGKRNTRESAADVSEYRRPSKPGRPGTKPGGNRGKFGQTDQRGGKRGRSNTDQKGGKQRLGKNRRVQMKAKKRRQ